MKSLIVLICFCLAGCVTATIKTTTAEGKICEAFYISWFKEMDAASTTACGLALGLPTWTESSAGVLKLTFPSPGGILGPISVTDATFNTDAWVIVKTASTAANCVIIGMGCFGGLKQPQGAGTGTVNFSITVPDNLFQITTDAPI